MSYNPMLNNPGMMGGGMRPQIQPYDYRPPMMMPPRSDYPPNSGYSTFNSQSSSIALFNINNDATNSLYVDGVPNDTTQREVSHIFRPFPGFQCVRLILKTANNNRQYFLCFVDFENALQATIAMSTLQGYRFDKNDKIGLKISYANDPKQLRTRSRRK